MVLKIKAMIDRDVLVSLIKEKGLKHEDVLPSFAEWRTEQLTRFCSDSASFRAEIAQLYLDAGLLAKAKNEFYTAATYAERETKLQQYEELTAKWKAIPGDMDDD